MDEMLCLFGNRIHERHIVMPEHIDCDAAERIEILAPVHIPYIRTFPMVEDNRITGKYRQIARRIPCHNFMFVLHDRSCLRKHHCADTA